MNRHTVRRALGDLADRGMVRARRGAGVFVDAPPAEYPLGKRVRFHQNIRATGRLPEKRVLRLETRPADAVEAGALGLAEGAPVLVYEGLSLANGVAVAHFLSLFPSERLPGLATTFGTVASVTEALRLNGIADYTRTDTRVSAERASPTQAPAPRAPGRRPVAQDGRAERRPGRGAGGTRHDLVRGRPGGVDRDAGVTRERPRRAPGRSRPRPFSSKIASISRPRKPSDRPRAIARRKSHQTCAIGRSATDSGNPSRLCQAESPATIAQGATSFVITGHGRKHPTVARTHRPADHRAIAGFGAAHAPAMAMSARRSPLAKS